MKEKKRMKFIRFGEAYLNMERVEMIRHYSGNVYEAVMTDGKRIVGSKKDLDEMDIVEKINSKEELSMVE